MNGHAAPPPTVAATHHHHNGSPVKSPSVSAAASSGEKHYIVAAIDFGTTYSGYAFSFVRDPDSIHMMRKWEGGDPGVSNQKTPTTLLLRPNGEFHSFGFGARDHYHDLEEAEAKKWYYFEKFKMSLHSSHVSEIFSVGSLHYGYLTTARAEGYCGSLWCVCVCVSW